MKSEPPITKRNEHLFAYTTLFRALQLAGRSRAEDRVRPRQTVTQPALEDGAAAPGAEPAEMAAGRPAAGQVDEQADWFNRTGRTGQDDGQEIGRAHV